MSQSRKFAHSALYDVWGQGKIRCVCCCGKQSPIFKDSPDETAREQAGVWYVQHTGLVENRPKARVRHESD